MTRRALSARFEMSSATVSAFFGLVQGEARAYIDFMRLQKLLLIFVFSLSSLLAQGTPQDDRLVDQVRLNSPEIAM
jgi:hypothetical protein